MSGVPEKESGYIIFSYLVVGISTAAFAFAYFWAGRKFLNSSHKVLTNLLSASLIAVMLFALTFILHDSLIGAFVMPLYYMSGTVNFFFRFHPIYNYLILAILPPLVMYAGMATRKK